VLAAGRSGAGVRSAAAAAAVERREGACWGARGRNRLARAGEVEEGVEVEEWRGRCIGA